MKRRTVSSRPSFLRLPKSRITYSIRIIRIIVRFFCNKSSFYRTSYFSDPELTFYIAELVKQLTAIHATDTSKAIFNINKETRNVNIELC